MKRKQSKDNIAKNVKTKKGEINEGHDDAPFGSTSSTIQKSCCTLCTSKELIRAVLTRNYELLKGLLEHHTLKHDIHHIGIYRSPDIHYNALHYAAQLADSRSIRMLWEVMKDKDGKLQDRAPAPTCTLDKADTGSYSQYTYGHRVRQLNMSRGGKEGNNAFMEDSAAYKREGKSLKLKKLIEVLVTSPHVSVSALEELEDILGDRWIEDDHYTMVVKAVRAGNREVAGWLVKKLVSDDGFGYNIVHQETLTLHDGESFSGTIRKTSVTKKPIDGRRMTPLHTACINPDPKYLLELLAIGAKNNARSKDSGLNAQVLHDLLNLADQDKKKLIHYAAACAEAGPLETLLSHGVDVSSVDGEDLTPMMIAAMLGRVDNVSAILRHEKNQQGNLHATTTTAAKKGGAPSSSAKSKATGSKAAKGKGKGKGKAKGKEEEEETDEPEEEEEAEQKTKGKRKAPAKGGRKGAIKKKSEDKDKDKAEHPHIDLNMVAAEMQVSAANASQKRTGQTVLHLACWHGQAEVVRLLLTEGEAKTDVVTKGDKFTPLMLASAQGHLKCIEVLLEHGAEVDAVDHLQRTALLHAAKNGHRNICALLASHDADLDHVDTSNNTASHYAAAYGWADCLELMVEKGAHPHMDNDWKVSPLAIAMMKGHLRCAEILLKRSDKVDVNSVKDDNGLTLVGQAISAGPVDSAAVKLLELLIKGHGANVTTADTVGNTPLHHLAIVGAVDPNAEKKSKKKKEEEEEDTDDQDDEGENYEDDEHEADESEKGHDDEVMPDGDKEASGSGSGMKEEEARDGERIMKLLLAHKADINAQNKEGMTPVMLAARFGHAWLVLSLLKEGCAITTSKGRPHPPTSSKGEDDGDEKMEDEDEKEKKEEEEEGEEEDESDTSNPDNDEEDPLSVGNVLHLIAQSPMIYDVPFAMVQLVLSGVIKSGEVQDMANQLDGKGYTPIHRLLRHAAHKINHLAAKLNQGSYKDKDARRKEYERVCQRIHKFVSLFASKVHPDLRAVVDKFQMFRDTDKPNTVDDMPTLVEEKKSVQDKDGDKDMADSNDEKKDEDEEGGEEDDEDSDDSDEEDGEDQKGKPPREYCVDGRRSVLHLLFSRPYVDKQEGDTNKRGESKGHKREKENEGEKGKEKDQDQDKKKDKEREDDSHLLILKYLLDELGDSALQLINFQDHNGDTVLHLAASNGYIDCLRHLLSLGKFESIANTQGVTPLLEATYSLHDGMVPMLLSSGASFLDSTGKALLIPTRGEHAGESALTYAAKSKHNKLMKCILDSLDKSILASVTNEKDEHDRTPLHWCLFEGDKGNKKDGDDDKLGATLRMIRHLLDHGADPNTTDQLGYAPIHYAFVPLEELEKKKKRSKKEKGRSRTRVKQNRSRNKNESCDPIEIINALCTSHASEGKKEDRKLDVDLQDQHGRTALHYAAECGSSVSLLYLINQGARTDIKDVDGNTSLGVAMLADHPDCAILLIQNGAKYDAPVVLTDKENDDNEDDGDDDDDDNDDKEKSKGRRRMSVFEKALRNDWQGVAYLLLDKSYPFQRAIVDAFRAGRASTASMLIDKCTDEGVLTELGPAGQTLFHVLASVPGAWNEHLLMRLKKRGVDVNLTDERGCSALHYAALSGHAGLCTFFLDEKLDVNARDIYDNTALSYACMSSRKTRSRAVEVLLEHGAEPTVPAIRPKMKKTEQAHHNDDHDHQDKKRQDSSKDEKRGSASPSAAASSSSSSTPSKSSPSTIKLTALICAIVRDDEESVCLLLDSGVDVNVADQEGCTPLMYAARANNINIARLLIAKKADVSAVDQQGRSVVHWIVSPLEFGSFENVRMLRLVAKKGGPLDGADKAGQPPIHYASKQATGALQRELKKLGAKQAEKVQDRPHHKDDIDSIKVIEALSHVKIDVEHDVQQLVEEEDTVQQEKAKEGKVEVDEDFNMTKNAEVYTVRGDKGAPTIYNTMLTEVNVKHGTYGKNNFYKMQVIRDTVKDMFILWTRWGRVGDDGQHQQARACIPPTVALPFILLI
eukprot:TRINITY_DN2540_c0_g1_i2.p1 TRINITY_DN2540_c0_g1~~TRINITY_DN2540_c0_g1_i2.p1  ORF type:complete len:2019 (-),score=594.67 TRINITY_DN2540_c0_g1_i2:668-6724(-)